MIRATLDSNIYVSALQFGGMPARILGMARDGLVGIDISESILDETSGVLRDKFGWEAYRLRFAALEIRKLARIVEPRATIQVARDPDDNRILECAVEAASDYIVTADSDLLALGNYARIPIVGVSAFVTAALSDIRSAPPDRPR